MSQSDSPSSAEIVPGLASVTFRQLSPATIVQLCTRSGLHGIEWGGDVHCPPDNLFRAREVAAMTAAEGLECSSYGSYYWAGDSAPEKFNRAIEVAEILDAPTIRVWAGSLGSADAERSYRTRVIKDLIRITSLAALSGKHVSLEHHSRTLTDEIDSTVELLQRVPELSVHWQPPNGQPQSIALETLRKIGGRLSNLHVLAWQNEDPDIVRLPLRDHAHRWKEYFAHAKRIPGRRFALLEFVKNDAPDQLLTDAQTLHELLRESFQHG